VLITRGQMAKIIGEALGEYSEKSAFPHMMHACPFLYSLTMIRNLKVKALFSLVSIPIFSAFLIKILIKKRINVHFSKCDFICLLLHR